MVLELPGVPVDLDGKQSTLLRNSFFPSLILLKSLSEVCQRSGQRKEIDAAPNLYQSAEEKFQTFVNKVAQICDYEPKGKTVTACVVIQQSDGVLYVLGSNDRSALALELMRTNLLSVLEILKTNILSGHAEAEPDLNGRLLRLVLSLNCVRVKSYLKLLGTELAECVNVCNLNPSSSHNTVILETLNQLLVLVPVAFGGQGPASDEYIESVVRLINTLQDQQRTPGRRHMVVRATSETERTCWSSVQHAAGRLISYQYAVETLTLAHYIWADTDLFLNFDVDVVPSSLQHPWPLKAGAESANFIISRMATKDQVDTYQGHAAELQKFRLDDMIAAEWAKKFSPIMHAEILLLDWLQKTDGGIRPYRFFQNWRYIGCSKPTCRLCRYYFDTVAPEVAIRRSHNNVYFPWRTPEVRRVERENDAATELAIQEGQTQWLMVMRTIKERLYKAGLRLLEEKVSDKKEHDSNTYTTRIEETGSVMALANRGVRDSGDAGSVADLAYGLEDLTLQAQVGGSRG